jgi:hypothetical protein
MPRKILWIPDYQFSKPMAHLRKRFNFERYRELYPEVDKLCGVYLVGGKFVVVVKIKNKTQVRDFHQACFAIRDGVAHPPIIHKIKSKKMKLETFAQVLTEAPQIIGELDFDLNDPQVNSKICIQLDKKGESIGQHNGNNLMRSGVFYYVKGADGLLHFMLQTKNKFIPAIREPVVIMEGIWRNSSLAVRGMPTIVMFDVLLPKHTVVLSDSKHSPDGRRFTENRMVEAINKGLFVYALQTMGPRWIKQLKSAIEIDNFKDQIWGEDKKFTTVLVVISNNPLDPKPDVQVLN